MAIAVHRLLLVVFLVFAAVNVSAAEPGDYRQAFNNISPWPVPSAAQTVDEAYQIQRQWVSTMLNGQHPVAFKRGLSTAAALENFNLDLPVTGVFPAMARLVDSPAEKPRVSKSLFVKPMIELELAILVSISTNKPFSSYEQFLESVVGLKLAVELPDLGFSGKPKGLDVISSNVAARYYIEKSGVINSLSDIEEVPVSLYFNGEEKFSAISGEILEGQLKGAYQMANQLLAQGWELRTGQALLTGSIGPMVPAEVGEYRASFGELGDIEFEVCD